MMQISVDDHSPKLFSQMKSTLSTTFTLDLNNRKHSQGSIQTRVSENDYCLEIDKICCQHIYSKHNKTCSKCGVFFFKRFHNFGVKSQKFFGEGQNIISLRQTAQKFQMKEVKPLNFESIHAIQNISIKFGFALSTQALGVYIYYNVFEGKNQFLEVVISLFVAAKLLQHTHIKSLRRYRRYLNKCFSYSVYQQMESQILIKMEFDINIPNFMSFLNSYLHSGVLLNNELADVIELENIIIQKGKQILFKGAFMMFPPQVIASNILFYARNRLGLNQPWSPEIQQITNLADPYIIFTTSEVGRMLNSI